jgi:hypothetical protein
MHDLDEQINRISGQNNYMEQLAKITGDINTVDKDMYKAVIDKCAKCDFNLKILAGRFLNYKDLDITTTTLFKDFLTTHEAFDIKTKTFVMVQKKSKKNKPPREMVDAKHLPSEVFKSEWFKNVRAIEKLCRKYLKLIFEDLTDVEQRTYEQFMEVFKAKPELLGISFFGGFQVLDTDSKTFMNIINTYKCSRIIINEFLNPMYDVRKKIESNYHIIEKAFKSKPRQQLNSEGMVGSTLDVINILEKFIVAKYRAGVTGNNKHYVKLFTNLIDPESTAELEGAKFLDIMDSLNLEELSRNKRAYRFAVGARDVISSIMKNESLDSEDIIARVQDIFGGDEPEEAPAETTEEAAEFDDLL